jgi:hypothetical protein
MSTPDPPENPYEKGNGQVREAAKWLIASSAAVGAALIAGSQLSSIGRLPVGLPVTLEAARLWVAVLGAVLGLVAVVFVLWTAVKLLPEVQTTIEDLVDEWDKPTPRLRAAVADLKKNPRYLQEFDPPKKLIDERRTAIAQLDTMSEAEKKLQLAYIADLDVRVRLIEDRARNKTLFAAFEAALKKLLLATTAAAIGIIAFAWAANPSDDPPAADLTNARLVGVDLRDADLANAKLDHADLTGADLTGADLTDASLQDVTWRHTVCPDGTNSDADGATCAGHLSP